MLSDADHACRRAAAPSTWFSTAHDHDRRCKHTGWRMPDGVHRMRRGELSAAQPRSTLHVARPERGTVQNPPVLQADHGSAWGLVS